jgi:hypothetical protein
LRPSGSACKKAIRSAVAAGSANGREQSRQNRHQHGHTSHLVPDFQSALDGSTAGELIPELVRHGLQQLIELEVTAVLGALATATATGPGAHHPGG